MSENVTKVVYSRAPGPDGEDVAKHTIIVQGLYDISDEMDRKLLMQEAAADFHYNRDGWDADWPITFAMYEGDNGPEIARYEIERESRPSFSVTRC